MKIEKPIFIIGTGRSGTTIFHDLLSKHKQLTWLSQLLTVFPKNIFFNKLLMHLIDFPIIGFFLKKIIKTTEPYSFWEENIRGFSRPCRDLTADETDIFLLSACPAYILIDPPCVGNCSTSNSFRP